MYKWKIYWRSVCPIVGRSAGLSMADSGFNMRIRTPLRQLLFKQNTFRWKYENKLQSSIFSTVVVRSLGPIVSSKDIRLLPTFSEPHTNVRRASMMLFSKANYSCKICLLFSFSFFVGTSRVETTLATSTTVVLNSGKMKDNVTILLWQNVCLV